MRTEHIPLPIVAIGGITFEDIPSIMETGVTGIALSGTILRAENPIEETKRILASGCQVPGEQILNNSGI